MQSDQGSKSHHCPKCSLVFKSKVYLFDHLNKVHCLNVDAALTSAGLKTADIQKAAADESRCPENSVFKCQLCDFAAFNLDVLTEHKKQNHENPTESVVNHETEPPESKIINTSTNQCNSEAEDEPCIETDPVLNCTSNSSKDLRMYKRPLQTATKVSSGSPDLNEHPYAKVTDNSKGTIILQETASSSLNPIWSGVCKVTAMSVIDISHVQADHHLQEDQLKPKEQNKEVHNQGDKRGKGLLTPDYNFEGPSAKKFKSKNRETELPESKHANQQPSGGTEFSFEVSDDEMEKSSVLVKENPPNPRVFFCKLCDYSDGSFKCIISHYQNYHPYVRSNSSFIHDSNDQSATFRCLECPVEFPSSVDLKWHYTEKHPEAPDVFNLQLNELSLAFKCFSCSFTTNRSKALGEHYKEKHPTCEIDNSLLFCQYSVSKCQEESPQVQTCQKIPSPEKSRELSPERVVTPCKDVKDEPSPQQPSPMPAGTLYRCKKCEFTHKSSIVMHVHYKRKHPNKKVTLDEIKQANHKNSLETSPMMPENESSEKANDKPEKPLQMKIKLPPLESKPRVAKDLSESCAPKQTESVQDETLNKSPKPNRRMTSELDHSVPGSAEELYYCMHCDYTNTQLKSVVGHHCSKHLPASRQDIIEYSADVRNKLTSTNSAKARKGTKKSKKVKSQYEEEEDVDASGQKSDDYRDAETLFYCQRCNLGNPTLQGVLNHQNQVHETLTVKAEIIMKHTASIRSNIKRSKSRGKSKSPTYLPLPIVNKGDENKYFCNLCNFRQAKLVQVLQHYSKTHQGSANKSAVVQQYTNRVLKWLQKSLSKAAANHELLQKTENGKNKANNSIKSSSSVPPAAGRSDTHRNLKCNTCSFSTPYVFLLRAHLRNTHHSNRPVKDVLAFCFRQGAIKEGYHCEWCVFSHKNANRVYKHYQESHPQHTSSLEYIHARLYVGPKKELLQKDTPKVESAHPGDGAEDRSASKSSKQIESETYSCTRCSFKSKSKSGLSRHTNEIHPVLAKDSRDSPSRKEASARSQLEELSEMPGVFESFQVPLEETEEPITSSTASDTKHSPTTHSPANRGKSFDAKKGGGDPADTQSQIHVFKCRYCNYFNTLSQGILTHCYMKHPSLTCKTDSLHLSPARIHKCRRTNEAGENVKFSGYMCKTCPQIFESKYGLNKHCEREHNKTVRPVSKVKSAITPAKPYSTHESVSKASFFSKHKYTKVKCQHCSVFCNTKTALHRHMQKEHLNTFSKDCLFKCMLCHKTYFVKNKLRSHYLKFHGKPALLKHYVPVHEHPSSQPEPRDRLQEQLKSTEGKLLIYKCPRCSYIHVSHHGILTHCQMKHPTHVARGHKLETGEILISDIVKCSDGKGKYQRGYQCKECPQIHPSMASLKAHQCKHGKVAASDDSLENPPASESEPGPLKDQPVRESTAEPVPSLSTTKNNECSYQCQVCTYKTSTRPKLRDHYKYTHKFNAASVYKLLEKYNKRKRNYLLAYAEYKKSRDIRCKVCPDLLFESCQLLIDHYSTFHKLNSKLDFTVLSLGLKYNTTGLYRCAECLIQLNGTKKLCYHLDRHKEMVTTKRRKATPAVGTPLDPKPSEVRRRDKGPTFELSKWSSAPAEAIVPPPSPRSPDKITMEESEADNQHPCQRCHRAFKSLRALQTHERGHAALAAIRKRDRVSKLNQDIKEFILYKSGTSKPFRCSCCIYRTNIINLMRSHVLKNHQDIIQRTKEKEESSNEDEEQPQREEMEPSESSEKRNSPEPDEDPEETEESEYSEHADVQRQLNHYSLVAQKNDKTNGNVLKSLFLENCTLYCEICTFNTEHLSSIRRHYMNRHGKKLLKCKDCEFVTGLRKTLELHSQMGHSTCESKPTHQHIIRCPFCLYHSKNKNNMIDHIVLHREERVLPVELNRPKLSRYLRGTVFRCHKCTFSSGSAETLRLHMLKHGGGIQPYRCRLCYFDCSQMAELEAHLSDKHQVLRNHQLVSQVDACIPNDKQAENKESVSDRDEIPQNDLMAEYGARDTMFLPIEEAHVKQEREEETSVSDVQPDDAQPQKKRQQDSPAADVHVAFALSAEGEGKSMHERLGGLEEEENPARLTGQLKEEAEEAQVDGLGFQELQQKGQISEATSEDDAERGALPQEEDGSRSHDWEDRKPTIKIEKVETVCADQDLRDEEGSAACSPNPTTNSVSANVSSAQTTPGGLTSERRSLTHSTRYTQQKFDWKSHVGAGLESCEPEPKQTPSDWKDTIEPRGEVPAPETERHEEQQQEETELLAQKQDAKDETRCKEQDIPNMCDADEAAGVPRVDKPFTCHFCGRNLTNAAELKRHVKRHGL
uniref:C2H2-type domain-containing protein n=1 Tax=Nothobranchius furzeri TaxID=105023 RepID=A0A1A8USP7_NOTFU